MLGNECGGYSRDSCCVRNPNLCVADNEEQDSLAVKAKEKNAL